MTEKETRKRKRERERWKAEKGRKNKLMKSVNERVKM